MVICGFGLLNVSVLLIRCSSRLCSRLVLVVMMGNLGVILMFVLVLVMWGLRFCSILFIMWFSGVGWCIGGGVESSVV